MLWLLMIFVISLTSFFVIGFLSLIMFPPAVDRLYANDDITVLRLDE
jgi:hypothetical protein